MALAASLLYAILCSARCNTNGGSSPGGSDSNSDAHSGQVGRVYALYHWTKRASGTPRSCKVASISARPRSAMHGRSSRDAATVGGMGARAPGAERVHTSITARRLRDATGLWYGGASAGERAGSAARRPRTAVAARISRATVARGRRAAAWRSCHVIRKAFFLRRSGDRGVRP